jgi:peptidyl-prolyl cis-trans isomerase B (cyclophilin B)
MEVYLMKHVLRGFMMIMVVVIGLIGCQNGEGEQGAQVEKAEITGERPVVTMTMDTGGIVKIELYPDIAPNTVNNFIELAKDGFYDGLIFHRVIPDFMIQGGDPDGNGTGGPGYGIKGEFSSNGFDNELSHADGVVSMARSQDPNSAGSQFFIVTGQADYLDGDYAAFGKVVDGMDVVKDIEAAETGAQDKPVEDQMIKSMTVELNGYEAQPTVKE